MKRIHKRMLQELDEIKDMAAVVAVRHHHERMEEVSVRIKDVGEVEMEFSGDHPFRPPKVRVNGMSYYDFFRLRGPRFPGMYHAMFPHRRAFCLCCHTLVSHDRWYPGTRVRDVLNELQALQHEKRLVGYSVLVEGVKERHGLPDDIDLLSFL
jgi:ubiquitin-protein ligase